MSGAGEERVDSDEGEDAVDPSFAADSTLAGGSAAGPGPGIGQDDEEAASPVRLL